MSSPALADLRSRRAFECRLDPARALRSVDEAAAFLADRGILTRTAACALPSLFGACHEPGYRPGRGGFADWPATAYPWFGAIAAGDGVVELAVQAGRKVLLTRSMAALADPVCRAELGRAEAGGGDPAALLRHLHSAGPSPIDDLKVELGWDAGRLRRARRPLERSGAVASRNVTLPAAGGGHVHTSVLVRWDHVLPEPAHTGSLPDLIAACVRAVVLVPEPELRTWFSWSPKPGAEMLAGLIAEGRIVRPEPGWLAAP
jgi:hypothetical protein